MFGFMFGVFVIDMMFGMLVVNLGMDKVIFLKLVYIGDMLYVEMMVFDIRESKLRFK